MDNVSSPVNLQGSPVYRRSTVYAQNATLAMDFGPTLSAACPASARDSLRRHYNRQRPTPDNPSEGPEELRFLDDPQTAIPAIAKDKRLLALIEEIDPEYFRHAKQRINHSRSDFFSKASVTYRE